MDSATATSQRGKSSRLLEVVQSILRQSRESTSRARYIQIDGFEIAIERSFSTHCIDVSLVDDQHCRVREVASISMRDVRDSTHLASMIYESMRPLRREDLEMRAYGFETREAGISYRLSIGEMKLIVERSIYILTPYIRIKLLRLKDRYWSLFYTRYEYSMSEAAASFFNPACNPYAESDGLATLEVRLKMSPALRDAVITSNEEVRYYLSLNELKKGENI